MKHDHLLARLFVCIAFKWDVTRLCQLKQTVTTVLSYPTYVDACVITDKPDNLHTVFNDWSVGGVTAAVCDVNASAFVADPLALVWGHREAMRKAASRRPAYTAYMYLEDDLHVQWHSMEAWAKACPALYARGFIYGFYRTEIQPATGQLMALDLKASVNMSEHNLTVHIPRLGNFVQLPQPFYGFWVASHPQLMRFMGSGFWEKEDALSTPATHYGTLERASFLIQLIDVPAGFQTRSVVPYDPATNMLAPEAAVPHLRNNYAHSGIYSIVPVSQVLSQR